MILAFRSIRYRRGSYTSCGFYGSAITVTAGATVIDVSFWRALTGLSGQTGGGDVET